MKENVIPSNLKMQDIFFRWKGGVGFFTAAPSCLKLTRQLRKKIDVPYVRQFSVELLRPVNWKSPEVQCLAKDVRLQAWKDELAVFFINLKDIVVPFHAKNNLINLEKEQINFNVITNWYKVFSNWHWQVRKLTYFMKAT